MSYVKTILEYDNLNWNSHSLMRKQTSTKQDKTVQIPKYNTKHHGSAAIGNK